MAEQSICSVRIAKISNVNKFKIERMMKMNPVVMAVIVTVMIYSAINTLVFLYQDFCCKDINVTWMSAVTCGPVMILFLVVAIPVMWIKLGVSSWITRRRMMPRRW